MLFEPIYIPRVLNMEAYIHQGDLFYSRAYTGTGVSHRQHRKKSEEVLEKIPGSKRSMYGYILTYSRL